MELLKNDVPSDQVFSFMYDVFISKETFQSVQKVVNKFKKENSKSRTAKSLKLCEKVAFGISLNKLIQVKRKSGIKKLHLHFDPICNLNSKEDRQFLLNYLFKGHLDLKNQPPYFNYYNETYNISFF